MNPLQIIRLVGVAIGLAAIVYVGVLIHNHGAAGVQQKWDAERAVRSQELATAQARMRAEEQELAVAAAEIRRKTNEEIHTYIRQRDALADRVRLAEARARVPSTPAAPSDAAVALVGPRPELLGTIGVADVDEAFRADQIRLELIACYAQYAKAAAAIAEVGAPK